VNVAVTVNGRQWQVALEPGDRSGTFTVTIRGKSRLVDVSWVDADTFSLIDGGAAREIRLHRRDGSGSVGVEFGGRLYEAVVARAGTRASGPAGAADAVSPAGAVEPIRVKAPMPGRIVRVLVGVGDRVTARQPVVVVEAMKMENELRAPNSGVVREVLVVPGAAVESGAVLIVVDPQLTRSLDH
jgi:biotin carboxyl carrier protein